MSGDKTGVRAHTKSYIVLSFLHRGAMCGMTVTFPHDPVASVSHGVPGYSAVLLKMKRVFERWERLWVI